jgi:hypothetical protein
MLWAAAAATTDSRLDDLPSPIPRALASKRIGQPNTDLPAIACALGLLAACVLACGSRTGLSAGALGSADAGTPPLDADPIDVQPKACGFPAPTQLADVAFTTGSFRAQIGVAALAPAARTLFVGAWMVDGPYNGDGFIASVPVSGGALTNVTGNLDQLANLQRYAGRDLVQDGVNLYYARPTFSNSTIYFRDLVESPLAGGFETVIPTPLPNAPIITAIAAGDPGAVWVVYDERATTASVLRWDGTTATVLGSFDGLGTRAFVVEMKVYIGAVKGLWSAALDGSGLRAVRTWGQGAGLLAANATSVFFTPDGSTVMRRDEGSGAESTIATGVQFAASGPQFTGPAPAFADATALYVATEQGILRVPVNGGAPAIFANTKPLQALTGDDCNVYWSVPDPSFSGDALVTALRKPPGP